MIEAWVAGATTTYAYDHTVARAAQITPTTTSHYPTKFYSIEYQGVGTTTATSTAYIWHGDTLVAYIEQPLADGVATGTPTTYYTHPDHLASTNVVTDQNGEVVEALDYYPYGAERIHTGSADADRTFIGQFRDDASSLSYLNARYYDGNRGQFTSQDPVFWEMGQTQEGKMALLDPQLQNSYSYAGGNPISKKDPDGRFAIGLSYSGSLEGGLGAYSANYASRNISVVVDPSTRQIWVVRSKSAAIASGYLNSYQSRPDNGQPPFVIGLYGGAGLSGSISPKMTNPADIGRVENSVNVNLPFVSFSAEGEETGNPTYSIGPGAKGVAAVSKYPVATVITRSYSVNQLATGAANQVAASYRSAIARIQSQIKSIQSKLNDLKARNEKQN